MNKKRAAAGKKNKSLINAKALAQSGNTVVRSFNMINQNIPHSDSIVADLKPAVDPVALDKAIHSPIIRSGIQVSQNRVVGSKFRLQLTPIVSFFNEEEKKEILAWASKVERMFDMYANSPEKYIDAERKLSFTEILRQTVSQDLIFGEHFLMRTERKNLKMGVGFCVQGIDPWRVKTPVGISESFNFRFGVIKDELGAAKAYCVYNSLPELIGAYYEPENWRIINRESTILINGREIDLFNILHGFNQFRPSQTRGYSDISTILPLIKQLDTARGYALQSMNLALKYAFFLEADPQTDLMRDVFQANLEHGETRKDDYGESLVDLQDWNKLYYDQFKTKFDSVDIPQLTPGEKINVLSPHQNALNAHGMIQDNVFILAKIFGLSQESLTGDFRNSNYSSARLSEALTWEGIKAKREASVNVDATTIFKGWADEMMLRGLLPLLPTRVNYWEKRDILLNCDWIGAGKIIIDENKYASSVKTMLECNVTTLRDVLNEQGKDLDEVLEQLAFEELRKSELGIKDENGQTTNQFFDVVGA
jgi:lambda family phage portal protein